MIGSDRGRAPLRPVKLGPADVVVERRGDGTILMRSPHALPSYPRMLTERLHLGQPREAVLAAWGVGGRP